MIYTGTSLKECHFTESCLTVLIPTENICFQRCERWSKTSEMYEDKRHVFQIMISAQFHSFDFSNCYLCLIKLKLTFLS